jgi:hypothetical protein
MAAYRPGKGTFSKEAWDKTGIQCSDPFAPTTAPTDTPVVSITIPASLALENVVPPTNQEEYDAIKSFLENITLLQTVDSFLIEGQTLTSIVVTAIAGQRGKEPLFFRSNRSRIRDGTRAGSSDDIAGSLYNQVTTQRVCDYIEIEDKCRSQCERKRGSLSNVEVNTHVFWEYTIKTKSPTVHPTVKPTESQDHTAIHFK